MNGLTPRHTALHSFCVLPQVRFAFQQEDETVLLSLRAHPLTLVPVFFNIILLTIVCLFLIPLIATFLTPVQSVVLAGLGVGAGVMYGWIALVDWYFNIGLFTNKQIVDVDFSILSFREVTRTALANVEDVTVKSGGFASSLFDIGNIFVQTAGTIVNIEFMRVPHPGEASHIIQQLLQTYGRGRK